MVAISGSGVDLFGSKVPTCDELKALAQYVNTSEVNQIKFKDEVSNKAAAKADPLKVGIGYYITAQYNLALETLKNASDCAEKYYYLSKCFSYFRNYDSALEAITKALQLKNDSLTLKLEKAAILRSAGKFEQAQAELAACSNFEKVSADYHYQLGRLNEANGSYDSAIAQYQAAIELDQNHEDAIFHIAYITDLHGDSETALDFYSMLTKTPPIKTAVLFNMATIYEDMGDFQKAKDCIDPIFKAFPNNKKAQLFKKDIENSMDMYIDEERERQKDKRNRVLEIPISDFELSVRSRNCLRKMNINTLGDLLKINENELLSYKNFGETSLTEIRYILESKGLRLGMNLEEAAETESSRQQTMSKEESELHGKSVEELELSVRARRALDRLGIRTMGDLVSKTEAELLGCKNFGITSLTEIKERLTKFNLSLRKLD